MFATGIFCGIFGVSKEPAILLFHLSFVTKATLTENEEEIELKLNTNYKITENYIFLGVKYGIHHVLYRQ